MQSSKCARVDSPLDLSVVKENIEEYIVGEALIRSEYGGNRFDLVYNDQANAAGPGFTSGPKLPYGASFLFTSVNSFLFFRRNLYI